MAKIKIDCGLNNPLSSPSREFEIDSLGTDISEFDADTITYNAALLGIIGMCDTILCYCVERIGSTIVIASSCIKNDCISLIKLIKCVKKYKPDAFDNVLESQLYLIRLVSDYFFKTEIERAYLADRYADFESVVEKTRAAALGYISSIFCDGVVSVSNADSNRLVYVSKSDIISLLDVTEDELFHGVRLRCENREVVIVSQDLRDIDTDMMLVSKVSSDDEDDREIILSGAVTRGIVTAMLYDN